MLVVKRNFPLDSIHSGAMLGNGRTGVTLWGSGNELHVTVGCADLWDHRGGMEWTPQQNFQAVRSALEAGDRDRIYQIFSSNRPGPVKRPSLIPVGRISITLPKGAMLLRYEQVLETGLTRIVYSLDGKEKKLLFHADMSMHDVLVCDGLTDDTALTLLPAWDLCKGDYARFELCEHNTLAERGFPAPQKMTFRKGGGFIQPMPADPSFALFYRRDSHGFSLGFRRGVTDLPGEAEKLQGYAAVRNHARKWWKRYWQDIPEVNCGDPDMDEIYWHGLYKYGIMTNPDGAVPGLQGPWLEDDRFPPWQGDYHFNINVQMCHMPGFKAGKFANLRRLFDLVLSWKEKLRENARCFAGIENGYMLPHAVDDRGVCMGSFWSGTIDHACAAWIAMMMFDYCDYTGDIEFLRTQVYDFMLGVLHVYETMLETGPDGVPALPVSVSPEYRGSEINAWGRNASFQLAAMHRLVRNLIRAAELLGSKPEKRWREIERKLPLASICSGEIAIWDGLLLEESHRHHSHLAGICPFDIYDPLSEEWKTIIDATLERWVKRGMGEWDGWCMSWAAQIHTRLGNGDMAGLLLKIWKAYFTTPGGGSLHDGLYKGFTIYSAFRSEIMQMDGCMGAVNAIQDQFMFNREGILRVFFGIPRRLRGIGFSGMYAPGGLRIGGRIETDGTIRLTAAASRNVRLRIQTRTSRVFEYTMKAGESLDLIQKGEYLVRCDSCIPQ